MREIVFRGKRIDNGEWVYGYLLEDFRDKMPYIIYGNDWREEWAKVDPETVGQYTGDKDKHKKEIWENDIVRHKGHFDDNDIRVDVVKYSKRKFWISGGLVTKEPEVIGNIHENKDLL